MDYGNFHRERRGGPRAGEGQEGCPFHGRGGPGGSVLEELLAQHPGAQLLFVGAVNCLRHKPFLGAAEQMRRGRLSLLCPSMTDFASGRYLHQVREAVAELAAERGAAEVVVIFGCQWVILSTDGALLAQEIQEECGVKVTFFDDSHLVYGDHA